METRQGCKGEGGRDIGRAVGVMGSSEGWCWYVGDGGEGL